MGAPLCELGDDGTEGGVKRVEQYVQRRRKLTLDSTGDQQHTVGVERLAIIHLRNKANEDIPSDKHREETHTHLSVAPS